MSTFFNGITVNLTYISANNYTPSSFVANETDTVVYVAPSDILYAKVVCMNIGDIGNSPHNFRLKTRGWNMFTPAFNLTTVLYSIIGGSNYNYNPGIALGTQSPDITKLTNGTTDTPLNTEPAPFRYKDNLYDIVNNAKYNIKLDGSNNMTYAPAILQPGQPLLHDLEDTQGAFGPGEGIWYRFAIYEVRKQ